MFRLSPANLIMTCNSCGSKADSELQIGRQNPFNQNEFANGCVTIGLCNSCIEKIKEKILQKPIDKEKNM